LVTRRCRFRSVAGVGSFIRTGNWRFDHEQAFPQRRADAKQVPGTFFLLGGSASLRDWSRTAGEAYKSGKGILEIIREKKILTEAQIKELLDPVKLTGLDNSKYIKTKGDQT